MSAVLAKSATAAVLLGAALGLSACQSRMSLADDYGQALRQDVVAQVADPDAHYKGVPPPASNGRRAGIAQERYNRNAVIQPASTSTSSAGGGGGGGGGGGPGG